MKHVIWTIPSLRNILLLSNITLKSLVFLLYLVKLSSFVYKINFILFYKIRKVPSSFYHMISTVKFTVKQLDANSLFEYKLAI